MLRPGVLLFFVCFCYKVSPLQWSPTPSDGATITACVGDTVTIPWNFTNSNGEIVMDIGWYYQAQGHSENTSFAGVLGNHFMLTSDKDRFSFLPSAGLTLTNAQLEDSGVYTVMINSHDGSGLIITEQRSVILLVAVAPMTSDSALHVRQRDDAVKDPVTGQWHMELQCGHFTSLGIPAVSPVWMTPSGQEVSSSRDDNGTFVLSLSSSLQSGNYTCHLPTSAPASLCLTNGSPLTLPAPYYLDERDARLTLLEAHQEELMNQFLHLMEVNSNQSSLISQLQSENANLQRRFQTSCADLRKYSGDSSGVRTIYPDQDTPITVYCDQDTGSGGWTVFQRRMDGSVDFYRDWADYQQGFGNLQGEFWLGLDNLRLMTSRQAHDLRVDLTAFDGSTYFASYSNFFIGDSSSNYTLHFRYFIVGTAGDSLSIHNGHQFSTSDRDNDAYSRSCAQLYHGAWWYNSCHHSNLNGNYTHTRVADNKGIQWQASPEGTYTLSATQMKIRPAA